MFEIARVPMLILNSGLRVLAANNAFYRAFNAHREQTEGRFVYDLGSGQWSIPRLRSLLEETLKTASHIEDFEVEHEFPQLGKRRMLLNAGRMEIQSGQQQILLSIEDVTEPSSPA